MYPISIVFHCTKDIHRLYGSRMERGLSRHICTEEDNNDCLWLALSSKFGVKNKEVKPLYSEAKIQLQARGQYLIKIEPESEDQLG